MSIPEICKQCGKLAYPGKTVTIAAEEYEELLRFRKVRETTYTRLSSFRRASRSKIVRDPELAEFILQCAETTLIRDIVPACVKRFGAARTPSASSISRFLSEFGR